MVSRDIVWVYDHILKRREFAESLTKAFGIYEIQVAKTSKHARIVVWLGPT